MVKKEKARAIEDSLIAGATNGRLKSKVGKLSTDHRSEVLKDHIPPLGYRGTIDCYVGANFRRVI